MKTSNNSATAVVILVAAMCSNAALAHANPPPSICGFDIIQSSCSGITIDPDIAPNPWDPNPFSVNWGDGVIETPSDSFSHTYLMPGTYEVCLTYTDPDDGTSSTTCQVTNINTGCACYGDPDFDLLVSGCGVQLSCPMPFPWPVGPDDAWPIFSVYWGDGSSDMVNDGLSFHNYDHSGNYNVTIVVECPTYGTSSNATQMINVLDCAENCVLPTGVNYSVDDLTIVVTSYDIPLLPGNIDFNSGNYSFYWSFGDGTFSTEPMPAHTFPEPGTFTTCWTVTCTNTGAQVQLYETLSVGEGCCPLPVNINFEIDGLTVTATSIEMPGFEGMDWSGYEFFYSWGDGFFSSEPLPSHEYPEPGTFNGCILCACDVCGARFYMYPSFTVAPTPCTLPDDFFIATSVEDGITKCHLFPENSFFDPGSEPFLGDPYWRSQCNNSNGPELQWNFNDEIFSTECYASRLMEEEGIFYFHLNGLCPETGETVEITRSVDLSSAQCVEDVYVYARFEVQTNGNIIQPFSSDPVKERESVIQQMFWVYDWGDGHTDTGDPSPLHVYDTPGDYTVTHTFGVLWEDGVYAEDTYSIVAQIDCPADIDNNGAVNTQDILQMLAQFGSSCGNSISTN